MLAQAVHLQLELRRKDIQGGCSKVIHCDGSTCQRRDVRRTVWISVLAACQSTLFISCLFSRLLRQRRTSSLTDHAPLFCCGQSVTTAATTIYDDVDGQRRRLTIAGRQLRLADEAYNGRRDWICTIHICHRAVEKCWKNELCVAPRHATGDTNITLCTLHAAFVHYVATVTAQSRSSKPLHVGDSRPFSRCKLLIKENMNYPSQH